MRFSCVLAAALAVACWTNTAEAKHHKGCGSSCGSVCASSCAPSCEPTIMCAPVVYEAPAPAPVVACDYQPSSTCMPAPCYASCESSGSHHHGHKGHKCGKHHGCCH